MPIGSNASQLPEQTANTPTIEPRILPAIFFGFRLPRKNAPIPAPIIDNIIIATSRARLSIYFFARLTFSRTTLSALPALNHLTCSGEKVWLA